MNNEQPVAIADPPSAVSETVPDTVNAADAVPLPSSDQPSVLNVVDEKLPDLDESAVRSVVEALLFVVDTPVSTAELAQTLDCSRRKVEETLDALRREYDEQRRGFVLRLVAGGWRLYTREEYAGFVERFMRDGQQARLTRAALETLAVIAYRQPVTRGRIAAIRGVGVDSVMRTLLTRGLVAECGVDPSTNAGLYCTTSLFLEKLGLSSLEDLPSLAPLLPEVDAVDDFAD